MTYECFSSVTLLRLYRDINIKVNYIVEMFAARHHSHRLEHFDILYQKASSLIFVLINKPS